MKYYRIIYIYIYMEIHILPFKEYMICQDSKIEDLNI